MLDIKEVIELFEKQIDSRDKIINKLLEERKEVIEIDKKKIIRNLIKDLAPYIIMIIWIIFYFCTKW